MATSPHASPYFRTMNRVMVGAARLGISPMGIAAVTIRGKRSGEPRTLPLTPHRDGSRLCLVAPYGEVPWVHNLRAAGEAVVQRGRAHRVRATELPPAEAAPILRDYVQRIRIVQDQFPLAPDAPISDYEQVARRYPVFSIERLGDT